MKRIGRTLYMYRMVISWIIKINQVEPLLYEALLAYRDSKQRSFHVPGHKNGQAYRHLVEQAEAGQPPVKDIVNEEHQHNGEIQNDGGKNVNQKVERSVQVGEHGADLESVERLSVEGAHSELELVPVRSFLR